MEEVTKQAEKLQDETDSQSISEDLQEGVLSSAETSLKILEMGNFELHEVRKRTATFQCTRCLTHIEEGFQFCHKCGAGIKVDESAMEKLRRKMNLLVHVTSPRRKVEAKEQENNRWQQHHGEAKDTKRIVVQDGDYSSILEHCRQIHLTRHFSHAHCTRLIMCILTS